VINVGDIVTATRNGGRDKQGRPTQRPLAGRTYRVTSIYQMDYGLGCTLRGMEPWPYRGYFLYVAEGCGRLSGWYFSKVEPADAKFTEQMRALAGA